MICNMFFVLIFSFTFTIQIQNVEDPDLKNFQTEVNLFENKVSTYWYFGCYESLDIKLNITQLSLYEVLLILNVLIMVIFFKCI